MCKYRPLAIGVDICDVFRNTADVVPKSEVEKIFEEIENTLEPHVESFTKFHITQKIAELKKKYLDGVKNAEKNTDL